MAYSYKGAISFGLIYIPITLFLAIKSADVNFHMLDKKTKSRIKYIKTCEDCNGKSVRQEDIVKGYEYERDKYVIFTNDDFERIKTKKDKNITIEKFVDICEIDPLYYDRSFYVVPTGAEKAYALLLKAMEDEGKAGIARTVLGSKEALIALHVKNGQMLLNTMFFHEEVQKNPVKEIDIQVSDKELDLAKLLIQNMTEALKIEQFENEYKNRVMEAIEQKVAGREIAAPKEYNERKVIDLMEALRMSIGQTNPKKKRQSNQVSEKGRS